MLNWSKCLFLLALSVVLIQAAPLTFWNRRITGNVLRGPLHASCSVQWVFEDKCDKINDAVIQQMHKWESADNCQSGGEKCLYKLLSHSAVEVKGTHETPVKHYVDDLTFTFTQDGAKCSVKGYSTSETWYAVLDYGTNYCNLHNLITGSGLDKVTGYSETTSDGQCTQYSTADCEKY